MNSIKKGLQYRHVPETTQQIIDELIISSNTRKSKVKKLIREKYTVNMPVEDFEESYRYAEHKVDWQARKFQKNFDEDYLAMVTIEVYMQRLETLKMELLACSK